MDKILVIGYGYWGPNLVRNLARMLPLDKISVCDLSEEARKKVLKDYPGITFYSQADEAIGQEGLSAVVVAVPVEQHYGVAKMALERGKHVLVEKPLTAHMAEANELVSIAKNKNLVLMVGHTFLFSPPVQKIKSLLEEGHLGKINYITSTRINLGIHRKDVSVVWDLAPHDLSIFYYWLNELPSAVSTFVTCTAGSFPDVAFLNLQYPSGAIGSIQVSWLAPKKIRQTTVIASEKMVIYEDTDPDEPVKIYDKGVFVSDPTTFGEYKLTYRTGDIYSPRVETKEPLYEELATFLNCIKDGTKSVTDGEFGARLVGILEAAERSWKNNGNVEKIDYEL